MNTNTNISINHGLLTPESAGNQSRFLDPSSVNDRPIPLTALEEWRVGKNARNNVGHVAKRHKKVDRENVKKALNKPTLRRLARRGGVKRIKHEIYATMQQVVRERVGEILKPAIAICEHQNRKTVNTLDIIYALKLIGNPIYGFGSIVYRDEIKSRAEYMRQKRATYAHNREEVQRQIERENRERENRRIDEQVRRMGGFVGFQ